MSNNVKNTVSVNGRMIGRRTPLSAPFGIPGKVSFPITPETFPIIRVPSRHDSMPPLVSQETIISDSPSADVPSQSTHIGLTESTDSSIRGKRRKLGKGKLGKAMPRKDITNTVGTRKKKSSNMILERPPRESWLLIIKAMTNLLKKRSHRAKERHTRARKIKTFNMNVSARFSNVFKSLGLEKKKNFKKFLTIRRSRKSKGKGHITRKLRMPPKKTFIPKLKTRAQEKLTRKSLEKVNSLRQGRVSKSMRGFSGQGKVNNVSLSPCDGPVTTDSRHGPRGPEKEKLGKKLGRATPFSPLSTIAKGSPSKRKFVDVSAGNRTDGSRRSNMQSRGLRILRGWGSRVTPIFFVSVALPFELIPESQEPARPILKILPLGTDFRGKGMNTNKTIARTRGPGKVRPQPGRSLIPQGRKVRTTKNEVGEVPNLGATIRTLRGDPLVHLPKPKRSTVSIGKGTFKQKTGRMALPGTMKPSGGFNINIIGTDPNSGSKLPHDSHRIEC